MELPSLTPALIDSCRAIVCDLDGTLVLGDRVIPGAAEFLERVLASGRRLFYFTNNSSHSRKTYLRRLENFGFPTEEEFLITSTDCAVQYMNRQGIGPDIYAVGNRDFRAELREHGFHCLGDVPGRADPRPDAVLLGFDTELTYAKIHRAYDLILEGAPYLATHADTLCPVGPGRFKPDVGSFIAMFAKATGGRFPKVLGKPEPEAVAAIAERAGCPPAQIAFVGDRLYTDIRMAANSEMLGILVLSGETSVEDLASSPDQPAAVVDSVRDIAPLL